MTAAARSYGRVAYTPPGEVAAVLAEVDAGRPVLVLLNLGVPSRPTWHYALIVGFDPRRNRMLLHSGLEAASPQKARPWLRRWDWAGRWALVLLPPGEWPAAPQRDRLLDALAAFEETSTPEAAGRAWRRASEEWPDEPIAWLGVGNARFRQGDPSGAAEAFRRALALDPQDRAARLNLALALAQSGRPCEGLETLGAGPAADDALTDSFERLADRLAAECAARPGSPG
jgi:tetratricopeptide (TPR) repeat protein